MSTLTDHVHVTRAVENSKLKKNYAYPVNFHSKIEPASMRSRRERVGHGVVVVVLLVAVGPGIGDRDLGPVAAHRGHREGPPGRAARGAPRQPDLIHLAGLRQALLPARRTAPAWWVVLRRHASSNED